MFRHDAYDLQLRLFVLMGVQATGCQQRRTRPPAPALHALQMCLCRMPAVVQPQETCMACRPEGRCGAGGGARTFAGAARRL